MPVTVGPGLTLLADAAYDSNRLLSDAYATGAQHPDFVELMDNRGSIMMAISGDETQDFLTKWQQGTAWLLQDAGLAKVSPEDFGIARPGE